MKIKINEKFTLGLNAYNFIVYTHGILKSGKHKGEVGILKRFYFSAPEQAFNYLLERGMCQSDATTLKTLLTALDTIKNELKTTIKDNILAIVDFKEGKESYGIELQKIIKMERALNILREDAEMALNDKWDRGDKGFKDQITLIDSIIE